MSGEGTPVAGGKHVVPDGVAVEELDGGKKKLSDQCPPAVKDLLEKKGLVPVYDEMVKKIVQESTTRSVFKDWKTAEFNSILDCYRDDFGEKGVKVALCQRTSGFCMMSGGTWLEFIDVDVAGDYVPQFDTGNYSGQTIKTVYHTLTFPDGVAVEEFTRYGRSRKKLKETCPAQVEKILEKHDLKQEYDSLVDDLVAQGTGSWLMQGWSTTKIDNVVKNKHAAIFEAKGVALFVSHKEEWVQIGKGGHMQHFRWLEFVDRAVQPNYSPQRGTDTK